MAEVGDRAFFIDVTAPGPKLIIFGAIDFSQALCRLASAAGWRVFVCDPRSQFATAERFPDATVIVGWPEEAFRKAGGLDPSAYVAVLTHDPKLDDAALLAALPSSAAYVGAMGSQRAQADRRARLEAAGLPAGALERLEAPIGLDLGAHTPEETALSIMAQLVAARNGRRGGPLSAASEPIHAIPGRDALQPLTTSSCAL